jgi:predicted acetyltransferase
MAGTARATGGATEEDQLGFRPPRDEAEALSFYELAAGALLTPVAKAGDWLSREGLENTRLALVSGGPDGELQGQERLAGGLAVQRMPQWYGGRRVPCGVVRAVAVAPQFRGARVGDRLMRAALLEMRQAGVAVSMLFPATQVLYRRVGYEQAGAWVEQSARVEDFPTESPPMAVERIELTDPRLRPLYQERARRSSGLLDRSEWLWNRTLNPPLAPLELFAYLFGPPDAPEGYLLLHVERNDERKGDMTLRDRALLTPAAVARARAFIAHHRSTIERVWLTGGVNDPLLIGLPNQTAEITRRTAWMLRLVDVPAALSARGYAPGVEVDVHLLVRDDVLGPAEQRLVLRIRGGQGEVIPGGNGDVELDVRGLAAMYSGFLSPDEIASLGYLGGAPGAAHALSAAFSGPQPTVHEWV